MFYSHQLLARKAPLGQIWMAATMHAKLNRKKLNKLNIIKICEEILNPSVPMALRLSGILMGGVVIVYERKVRLLLDDVTRLLVEINQAWKVKATSDPTLLPKGKMRAKYESVTLPKNREEDLGEIEQSLEYSDASTVMGFQKTAFIAMRLDSVDELYVNNNPLEDLTADFHQADNANITLFERFTSYEGGTGLHNNFERFDIEGDDETHLNFTPPEHTEMPSTVIPSPAPQEESQKHENKELHERMLDIFQQDIIDEHGRQLVPSGSSCTASSVSTADEIPEERPAEQANQQFEQTKEDFQHQLAERRAKPARRRQKRPAGLAMDYEQTIIPGHIYQSWLQSSSDVVSGRSRKRKNLEPMSSIKMIHLMELPPIVLNGGLFTNGTRNVYYPPPLMDLWLRSIQPPHDSPSGRTSPPQPPVPSSSSPPERVHFDPPGYHFEDFQSGAGSQSVGVSIEKQRTDVPVKEMPTEVLMQGFETNLLNVGVQPTEPNGVSGTKANLMTTPGNSGDDVRSFPSSGSGHGFQSHNSEVHSGRKRPYSASRHSGSSLEPVAEENSWHHPDPDFKLARLSENDLLFETGPTQSQKHPIINQPLDHITESIRMQMKAYFDAPEAPKVVSLNQLASGMNRKRAAHLFYQTCVIATREFIKVEQRQPYGDILMSKGPKI